MKKLISLILILFTLFLSTSCTVKNIDVPKEEKKNANENITYILDGEEIESVSPDLKVVAFIRAKNDGDTRGVFDYESNDLYEGTNDQTVYLKTVNKLYGWYAEAEKDLENLEVGELIGTISYFCSYEQGGAVYTVKEVEGVKVLNLVPFEIGDQKVATVEMYGAYGYDDRADNEAINNAFADTNVNYIEFEAKEYLQTGRIYLNRGEITIDGCGAQINNKYDYILKQNGQLKPKSTSTGKDFVNFESTNSTDFEIKGTYSAYIKNIVIKNLTLYCSEMRGVGSLYNRITAGLHYQMVASYVDTITVSNCKFIVPERTGIGTGLVDGTGNEVETVGSIIKFNNNCLTFKNAAKNVIIENNTLLNYCGGAAGCTLDISNGSHYNYIIRNNYIDKNCHDEIFVIYGTYMFDGADIYGNVFKCSNEPGDGSAHPLGFNAYGISGYIQNVKFHDNVMDAASAFDGINFGDCKNIEIYNNDLTIKPNTPYSNILYGFFRVPGENSVQQNIYIHDNKIKAINTGRVLPMNYNCGDGFKFENNDYTFEYYKK